MRSKTHKRSKKGGYYGASGPIVKGGDAMQWNAGSEMGSFTADQINAGAKMTGGRRRSKARRGKKGRKTRRGGGKYGGVSASYGGDGVAGMANYKGASTRVSSPQDIAAFGKFNDNGASPGNFGSFGGMFPK
jgi:hypothetical protein